MTSLINYMIEANCGIILLFVFYKLLLEKETDFNIVRIFLLTGIIASLLFPAVHLSDPENNTAILNNVLPESWLPEIIITGEKITIRETQAYDKWKIISIIYEIGALTALIIFIAQVISLIRNLRSLTAYQFERFKIIESTEKTLAFSFFNYIFIGSVDSLSSDEKQQIIAHEKAHAERYHSLDILIINFLKIIFWFNPMIYLYKKIFVQLHEFDADARAVKTHDVNNYCSLMARVAVQSAGYSIANHFNHSLTIKRIEMIRSIKKKITQWKFVALFGYIPALFLLLACHDQVIAQQEKPKVENSPSNEIYQQVDQLPTYAGGYEALGEFLGREMKYPQEARKNNAQGTSHISFVVEKDGSLSDVKIEKGFNELCDKEALRVVKLTNQWNAGMKDGKAVRTKMILPVNFKL